MTRRYSLRTLALTAVLAALLLPLLALGGGLVGTVALNPGSSVSRRGEVEEAERAVARLVTDRWEELGDRVRRGARRAWTPVVLRPGGA